MFLDAAISLQFPTDWSISAPAFFLDSGVRQEGVTIQKGNFVVSARGAKSLQASGVEGGRLPEYLKSGALNVGCFWSEGNPQVLKSEATQLRNGIAMTDYYLDVSQLAPAAKSCLSAPFPPASQQVYVGSSSGLMRETDDEQSLITFYTSGPPAIYLKGGTALLSALREMRDIAETFKPVFDPRLRSNGASVVSGLRNAGFAYSRYPSDNSEYPGYDEASYFTCSAADQGYWDYVTSFRESISPSDEKKLLNILSENNWTKCRTAGALSRGYDKVTRKEIQYTYPVDVYTKDGEILNVISKTVSGNATVIVPWALERYTN